MVLISTLIADILVIPGSEPLVTVVIYLTIIFVIAVIVGLIESLIARARMSHVPQFIFLMTALALIAFAVVAFFLRGGF